MLSINLTSECSQSCLRHLHIMCIVPTADADAANDPGIRRDWIAAAKYNQAIRLDDAVQQRRIILHKVKPLVCRHAEANRRICLVLGNLHAQKWRAIHTAESLERAIAIYNRDTHRSTHFVGFGFSGSNETLCCLNSDTGFQESVLCHRNEAPLLLLLHAITALQRLDLGQADLVREL